MMQRCYTVICTGLVPCTNFNGVELEGAKDVLSTDSDNPAGNRFTGLYTYNANTHERKQMPKLSNYHQKLRHRKFDVFFGSQAALGSNSIVRNTVPFHERELGKGLSTSLIKERVYCSSSNFKSFMQEQYVQNKLQKPSADCVTAL